MGSCSSDAATQTRTGVKIQPAVGISSDPFALLQDDVEENAMTLFLRKVQGATTPAETEVKSRPSSKSGGVIPQPRVKQMTTVLKALCSPSKQYSREAAFNAPSETLLIWDWDDTIFPTTAHGQSKAANGRPLDSTELNKFCQAVLELLNLSQDLGHSVIITSAVRPWVQTSAWDKYQNRDMMNILREMSTVYANEGVAKKELQDHLQENHIGKADRLDAKLTYEKANAMKQSLTSFYSQSEGQSWGNIISVGDSDYEYNAIKQVVSERPGDMQSQPCRLKRIKLKKGPTLDDLLKEVKIVTRWLKQLVDFNGDVDIELASAALPDIIQWETHFGPAGSIYSSNNVEESVTPTNTGGSSMPASPQTSISSTSDQGARNHSNT